MLRVRDLHRSYGELRAVDGVSFEFALGDAIFGVRVASVVKLALATVTTSLCFVGIMMLMATIGKTEEAVAGSGWAILLVLSMIGGAMVPRIFMPAWMQSVSNLSPIRWGILAFEGATWRGFSYAELLLPCGILLAVGAVCFALGVRVLSRAET